MFSFSVIISIGVLSTFVSNSVAPVHAQTTETVTLFNVLSSGRTALPIEMPFVSAISSNAVRTADDVFSPVSTGSDGAVELTGFPSTVTVTDTRVESASGYHVTFGAVPNNLVGEDLNEFSNEECTLGDVGKGSCVLIVGWEVSGQSTTVATVSVGGTIVPLTTIEVVQDNGGMKSWSVSNTNDHTWDYGGDFCHYITLKMLIRRLLTF
ncbi:hypothetical protein VKT23_018579 [Stygiomarasmius scandens]|uniref:Uncharacterized protein n=1 Tax=Marasmiellus scandens TaxID=2682957 RepID=A0ABR1INS8_9AGAR